MSIGELAVATTAALPAINNALSLVDRVTKVVKASSNLDAQEAVVELRSALLSVKEENLQIREENLRLRDELKAKQAAEDAKNRLVFEYPNYFLQNAEGGKDGPFCKSCKDSNDKLIRLTVREAGGCWFCDVCKTHVESLEHKRNQDARWSQVNYKRSKSWMV